MSEAAAVTPKPKKSVALSGVTAGNTALCTVGRTGNDLHYRGYDILDIAEKCEFEEIAYLLVHGKLPTAPELAGYKTKLRGLRGIPGGGPGHPRVHSRLHAPHGRDAHGRARRWARCCRKARTTSSRPRATSPTG